MTRCAITFAAILAFNGCNEPPERRPTTDREVGADEPVSNVYKLPDWQEQADSDARHHAEREPLW